MINISGNYIDRGNNEKMKKIISILSILIFNFNITIEGTTIVLNENNVINQQELELENNMEEAVAEELTNSEDINSDQELDSNKEELLLDK